MNKNNKFVPGDLVQMGQNFKTMGIYSTRTGNCFALHINQREISIVLATLDDNDPVFDQVLLLTSSGDIGWAFSMKLEKCC